MRPLPGGRAVTRSAQHRRSRAVRKRLPIWLWVALAVLAVGAYGAISAVRLLGASSHIEAGIVETHSARAVASVSDLEAGRPIADVDAAAAEFDKASATVNSSWFTPVSWLPYIGRQLASTRGIARSAATVADATAIALPQVRDELAAPHSTPDERLRLVEKLAGTIATLRERTSRLNLGPTNNLLDTLAAKRNAFQADVDTLQAGLGRASSAASGAAQLLRGPGTWLVLASNNAEMRDGSGMFLEAGVVKVADGAFQVGAFQPTSALSSDQPAAALSGDLAARWSYEKPNVEWRNLGLSPQLPLNAQLAAAMWQARSGQTVDGVVTVDVAALADILKVTGPVTVGSTTYSFSSTEQQLLVDQYQGLSFDEAQTAARHEQLGLLAAAALSGLQSSGLQLSSLSEALDDAANGRHLMIWSSHPSEEQAWKQAGVDGSVAPNGLLLGLMNQGANKIDPFQTLAASLAIRPGRSTTQVSVRVTVNNEAPGSLSRYAGDGDPGPRLVYNGCLSLDLPAYAGYISYHGGGAVEAGGSDGPSDVLAVAVTVPRRGQLTLEWDFTLLGSHGTLVVEPSARLPATQWAVSGASSTKPFDDYESHKVNW